jgi:hypothetical protein
MTYQEQSQKCSLTSELASLSPMMEDAIAIYQKMKDGETKEIIRKEFIEIRKALEKNIAILESL